MIIRCYMLPTSASSSPCCPGSTEQKQKVVDFIPVWLKNFYNPISAHKKRGCRIKRCLLFVRGADGKYPGLVLVAADHRCSFTENRISGKLAGAARSDSAWDFAVLFVHFAYGLICSCGNRRGHFPSAPQKYMHSKNNKKQSGRAVSTRSAMVKCIHAKKHFTERVYNRMQ